MIQSQKNRNIVHQLKEENYNELRIEQSPIEEQKINLCEQPLNNLVDAKARQVFFKEEQNLCTPV